MRVYHQLVFDQFLEGAIVLYTSPALNAQLALTEVVELIAIADSVSGTSPTLTVALEESPDGVNFVNRNSVPEINAVSLSTSANTTAVGRDPGVKLGSGFARLRVQIGGSSQKAHVQIWATGIRDDRETPLTIFGQSVLQWVRSDLGITLNGTTVSTWADQSGKGNDFTQGTATNQPLYVTGGPGNKPYVSSTVSTITCRATYRCQLRGRRRAGAGSSSSRWVGPSATASGLTGALPRGESLRKTPRHPIYV